MWLLIAKSVLKSVSGVQYMFRNATNYGHNDKSHAFKKIARKIKNNVSSYLGSKLEASVDTGPYSSWDIFFIGIR